MFSGLRALKQHAFVLMSSARNDDGIYVFAFQKYLQIALKIHTPSLCVSVPALGIVIPNRPAINHFWNMQNRREQPSTYDACSTESESDWSRRISLQ